MMQMMFLKGKVVIFVVRMVTVAVKEVMVKQESDGSYRPCDKHW